ncbi:outer dense fiber protein 3-like [Xiphophorus maculatus]|uniref:Outer dense fiber protein 3-like n=1 Tax=Xiphophorus maculatus TaxID=8083 RepID=M3ZF17_XIPMA|nr:outer dense fiber protein 3-like [Xiphophorus maculatus]
MVKDDPWVGTWRPHRPRGLIAAQLGTPGPKYVLPGLTGANNHDVTKPKAPAYSISARPKVTNTDCSPGPKYMIPPNLTRFGKDGTPAYSIHGRPKPFAMFRTPGPAQYYPENAKKSLFRSAPSFTLSARHKDIAKTQTPGPASYKLPGIIGTKEITSPSSPSFTLMGRTQKGSFFEDLRKTPGPAAYNPADPYYSRLKPPQCTMKGRNFLPDRNAQTPGPGAYYPEKTNFIKPKAPSVTFGIHHSPYSVPFIVNMDGFF